MARCIRAAITNPLTTKSAVISYNRCSDNQLIDDYQIKPGDTIRIWFVEDTFSSTFLPFLDFDSSEIWPLTPTASETPTPTPGLSATATPTPTETPGVTASETPTPTPTPTETTTGITPTPTQTITETLTPTVTPTNTETPTPTVTPTNTVTSTPTVTPTNTPTPSSTPPIQGLFFTIQEVGPDVVLSGTGTANLSSLNLEGTFFSPFGSVIRPSSGRFSVGSGGNYSTYSGSTFNPVPFGSGFLPINADISTGNNFGIGGFGNLVVPQGYVGGALNGTGTFTGTTLATLGVTVPGGPYLVQWGASGASETITLEVISTVPTPTPTVTETPTETPTPTVSETATSTPTPTGTPAETPTPTVSETATNTPTPTVSETPTETPTNTPTSTVTPTVPLAGYYFWYTLDQFVTTNPDSDGEIKFRKTGIPNPGNCTYNLNETVSVVIYKNLSDGTSLETEFQNLSNLGGQISISQNGDTFVFTGTSSTFNYVNSILEFFLTDGTVVTPASGSFVSGSPMTVSVVINPTPTPTITPTSTPTETPGVTASETPTPTPTGTPVETPTPTVSETPTETPTPTVTETPTETPTPTVTETPTGTPTPTVTETPTNTPTNSVTPSITPTISPSPQPPNPSLLLDFDASVATNFTPTASQGLTVTQWDNLVIGGLPFTGGSFNSPLWETLPTYNNLGSLEFGAGQRLWNNLEPNFDNITGYTLFWIFNTSSVSTTQFMLASTTQNPTSNDAKIFIIMNSDAVLELQYLDSAVTRRFAGWTTDVNLLTVIYNGSLTASERFKVRVNGVETSPSQSTGLWPSSMSGLYGLSFSSPSGGLPLLGNVGALKLYNSAIDLSEITSVENQLMTKFGI